MLNNTIHARIYKSVHDYKTRTIVRNLGRLERLVLQYAIQYKTWTFSPADVRVYAQKLGYVIDRRRIFDAIQRLVKRNILIKIGRGIYKFVKDIPLTFIKNKDKDNLSPIPPTTPPASAQQSANCNLIRIHTTARDFEQALYNIELAYHYIKRIRSSLHKYLVKHLGVSRKFIKRISAETNKIVNTSVVNAQAVIGAHGKYSKKFTKFSPLIPLNQVEEGFYYEYGIDVYVKSAIPKLFVKIYTTKT